MKTRVVLIALLFLGLRPAAALAGACAAGSLASYIGAAPCTVDGLTFSGFSYTPGATGGATAVLSSGITVTPVLGPGGVGGGFTFSGVWSVDNSALTGNPQLTLDSLIGFSVSTNSGAATINDASIVDFSGAAATGTGTVTVTEGLCLGGTVPPCPGGNKSIFTKVNSVSAKLADQAFFTPTGTLTASKDMLLSTGSGSGSLFVGSADISSITDTFSIVPEPATLLLFGTGLIGMAGVIRRRLITTKS